jgi:hypothetical protein
VRLLGGGVFFDEGRFLMGSFWLKGNSCWEIAGGKMNAEWRITEEKRIAKGELPTSLRA